jgi:nitrite reductase/ring-hydroxylating ferredoxin subunit
MQPILPGAPWLIAHRSQLGVNQPQRISLNGQDFVLWQTAQGDVFALDNVCPHMQAPLSNGWICQDRKTIACPFHALEFDGQGRLHQQGNVGTQSLLTPLELIIKGDCIWTFKTRFALGEILQVHVLYPETATQTKTFVLVYAKFSHPVLQPLLQRSLLSAVTTVVEQDTGAIETSYPRQPAKIRLPHEEIMFHAEKLYREW